MASHLVAPIILLDRGWPGAEWRTAVQRFAALPIMPVSFWFQERTTRIYGRNSYEAAGTIFSLNRSRQMTFRA